jgi:hypothetical protein
MKEYKKLLKISNTILLPPFTNTKSKRMTSVTDPDPEPDRKDPKLLAGSGSEINVSDPDSNSGFETGSSFRIRNKAVKRSLIFRPKKGNFRQLWNISTFTKNNYNLIRISIFATQFTSNWLIGIHCPGQPSAEHCCQRPYF